MTEKKRRIRCDYAVDQLPDELKQGVRAMLINRIRRQDIVDHVARESDGKIRLSQSSLSRYWHGVLKNELDEATRRTQTTIAIAKAAREAAELAGDDPAAAETVMLNILDGAFLGGEIDLAKLDPSKILKQRAALARVQLARDKLGLQERQLDQQIKKFELEIKKLQGENARREKEEKRRQEAAERAIDKAERGAMSAPEKRALGAIRKALGIKKDSA